MKKLEVLLLTGVLSFVVCFSPSSARAKFPEKPINIIIGYAPGGTSDNMARVLAEYVGKIVGQKVTVENRTGGGGIVCWTAVAKAQPDGYTLGILSNGTITAKYVVKGVMFTYEDFEPLATISIAGVHFLVKKGGRYDMPFPKLVDYIREHPGEVKVGLSGTYNSNDFTRILLERTAKISLPKVPFKGDSDVIPAVLGDHVAIGQITGFPAALSLYRGGKINSLAVSTDVRDPSAPDVPTLKELGFGFYHNTFWSIAGPKGMPKDRSKTLVDTIKQAMEMKETQESFKNVGLPMRYEDPQNTLKLWKSYDELYGQLSKELGIEPK